MALTDDDAVTFDTAGTDTPATSVAQDTLGAQDTQDEGTVQEEGILTFPEWIKKQDPKADPLDNLRGFSRYAKTQMLKQGAWDDEEANKIDELLAEKAVNSGLELGEDPVSAIRYNEDDSDIDIVAKHASMTGDEVTREAAMNLRALMSPRVRGYVTDEDEYQQKLTAARESFRTIATPDKVLAARKAAVDDGDIPFAVLNDGKNPRLYMSDEMRMYAGNDEALGRFLENNPQINPNIIPALRKKLSTPEGYEAPEFVFDRQQDFLASFQKEVSLNPEVDNRLRGVAATITGNRPDQTEQALDTLMTTLSGTDLAKEFTKPEERKAFLKDLATRIASPNIDEENVDKNVLKLSTGEVVLPRSVMIQKPVFDRVMKESTVIPEAQKKAIIAARESTMEEYSDQAFKVINASSRGEEFRKMFQKSKAEGKSNAAILDEWMSNPDNHSSVGDFTVGIGRSVLQALPEIPLGLLALSGNNWSREVLQGWQEADANRRAYADLYGKRLGWEYDLSTLLAPVVADMVVSRGILTAAKSSVKTSVKAGLKGALRGYMARQLGEDTASLASRFIKGRAAKELAREGVVGVTEASIDDVVRLAGRDFARGLEEVGGAAATSIPAFTRSAGSTYVQLYSALEREKNADGSRKFTDEQIREKALDHALVAGGITAALTSGFSLFGMAGAERILSGNLTRTQLNQIHRRTLAKWSKLPEAVRNEIGDISTPTQLLQGVIKKSLRPLYKSSALQAGLEEMPEEALDSALGEINRQVAMGEKIDPIKAVKEGVYAGALGFGMGGVMGAARGARAAFRGPDATSEDFVRRQSLLQTARKLDESNLPETAAVLRRFAQTGIPQEAPTPAEGTPTPAEGAPVQGTTEAGLEQAPSEAGDQQAAGVQGAESVAQIAEQLGLDLGTMERAPTLSEMRATVNSRLDAIDANETLNEQQKQAERDKLMPILGTIEQRMMAETRGAAPAGVAPTGVAPTEAAPTGVAPDMEGTQQPLRLGNRPAPELVVADLQLELGNKIKEIARLKVVPEEESEGQKVRRERRLKVAQGRVRQLRKTIKGYSLETIYSGGSPVAGETVQPITLPNGKTSPSSQVEIPTPVTNAPEIDATGAVSPVEGVAPQGSPEGQAQEGAALREGQDQEVTPEGEAAAPAMEQMEFPLIDITETFQDPATVVNNRLDKDPASEQSVALDPNSRAAREQAARDMGVLNPEGITDSSLDAIVKGATEEPTQQQAEQAEKVRQTIEAELAKHGDPSTDITAFLKSVAKKGKPIEKFVARLMLNFPEMLATVPITRIHRHAVGFAGANITSANDGKGQILINTARPGPRGAVDTVLHELFHAATEYSIQNPTEAQKKVLDRLDRVRKTIRKAAQRKGLDRLNYATGSMSEFLTHFITSDQFKKDVSDLTPRGQKNWFRVVLEGLRDLVNGKVPGKNDITDEVMRDLLSFTQSIKGTYNPQEQASALFLYAGENADVDPFKKDSLATARTMAAVGKTSAEIRAITGWFPGPDGKMRWEIPDNEASPVSLEQFENAARATYGGVVFNRLSLESAVEKVKKGEVLRLKDILKHDQLFKAYPAAAELPVFPIGGNDGSGSFRIVGGEPFITVNVTTDKGSISNKTVSTLLHEVQHFIQNQEGFSPGGSPDTLITAKDVQDASKFRDAMIALDRYKKSLASLVNEVANEKAKSKNILGFGGPNSKILANLDKQIKDITDQVNKIWANQNKQIGLKQGSAKEGLLRAINRVEAEFGSAWTLTKRNEGLQKIYRLLAGEVEARDVEARRNLTAEQRAAMEPYTSEDIAFDDMIITEGTYGTPRMDQLMLQPADDQRISRFLELTEDLRGDVTQTEIDAWKNDNPEAYEELKLMRDGVEPLEIHRSGPFAGELVLPNDWDQVRMQPAVTAEQDAEYLRLAANPEVNREELQRMVDDAAEKAGAITAEAVTYAATSNEDTGAYHYGDAGIGSDTKLKRMSPGRGTGHFGTGTYFFGTKQPSARGGRPEVFLDLEGLNLIKAKNAMELHQGLRGVNTIVMRNLEADTKNPSSDYQQAIFKLWSGLNYKFEEQAIADTIEHVRDIFLSQKNDDLRTPSTYFMQLLGFDGIDVRGTDLDNGDYGSVVYPPLTDRYWYHGKSPDKLTQFDFSKSGKNTDDGGGAVWLSSNLDTAKTYRSFVGKDVPFYKLENLEYTVQELKDKGRHIVPAKDLDLAVDQDNKDDVYFRQRGEWKFVGTISDPKSLQEGMRSKGYFLYKDEDLIVKSFVFAKNPLLINEEGALKTQPWGKIVGAAKANGNDAVIFKNTIDTRGNFTRETGNRFMGDSIAVFSPEQIKSADPVTYDDEGNVIPLSQRFQATSPDIRFQPAVEQPIEDATETDARRLVEAALPQGISIDDLEGIDYQRLAEDIDGAEPANAQDMAHVTVNRSLGLRAGKQAIAADNPTAEEVADTVDVYERTINGSTTASDVATMRTNRPALDRFVKFLRAAANTGMARLRTRWDAKTSSYVDRLSRELARAKAGYRVSNGAMMFDIDNPTANERFLPTGVLMQPAVNDEQYMRLAANPEANRDELQRMVDAAAKAAGYNIGPVYHGTENQFNQFIPRTALGLGKGIYFASEEDSAKEYGSRVIPAYLNLSRPLVGSIEGFTAEDISNIPQTEAYRKAQAKYAKQGMFVNEETNELDWQELLYEDGEFVGALARDLGYDGIIEKNSSHLESGDEILVFSPEQIKSADPVTYDNEGNVIPLSQRFQVESPDIRFQPAVEEPIEDATETDARRFIQEAVAQVPLPEGVTLDDLEGIDYQRLAEDIDGAEPANAQDMAHVTVNRSLGLRAGKQAIAADNPTAEEVADTVDVYERTINGSTTASDVATMRTNRPALDRFVKFLRAAANTGMARLRTRWDAKTSSYVDRLSRELARAKAGYRVSNGAMMFDIDNPTANERFLPTGVLMQPAVDDEQYLRLAADPEVNRDELQRRVNAAARAANLIGPWFHGGSMRARGATVASIPSEGFFLAKERLTAESYGKRGSTDPYFFEQKNAFIPTNESHVYAPWVKEWIDFWRSEDGWVNRSTGEEMSDQEVFDMISSVELYYYEANGSGERWKDFLATLKDHHDGFRGYDPTDSSDIAVVFSPEQIKSADPVTRDNNGNVIPLSQRFQTTSPDIRFQPATNPEDVTSYTKVQYGNPLLSDTGKVNPSLLRRLFVKTDDLRDPWSLAAKIFKRQKTAGEALVQTLGKEYSRLVVPLMRDGRISKETVNTAFGSTKPLLSVEDEVRIDEEFQARLDAASALVEPEMEQAKRTATNEKRSASTKRRNTVRDAMETATEELKDETFDNQRQRETAIRRRANDIIQSAEREYETTVRQIDATRDAALEVARNRRAIAENEATDLKNKEIVRTEIANAKILRKERDLAIEDIRKVSPEAADHIIKFRKAIDSIQRDYAEKFPDRSLKVDRSLGLYLVRSYEIHQNPGWIEKLKQSPEYADLKERVYVVLKNNVVDREVKRYMRRADTTGLTEDQIRRNAFESMIERRAERLAEDEAYADAPIEDLRKVAEGQFSEEIEQQFEDYLHGHETLKNTPMVNTSIKNEVGRWMKKGNIPEPIRQALGEITDPLFNASRTYLSLAHTVAAQDLMSSMVSSGVENGWMITEAQKLAEPNKYRNWVAIASKDPDSPAYTPLAGYYVEQADRDAFDSVFRAYNKATNSSGSQMMSFFNKMLIGAAGTSLGVVTLGNPGFYSRNILGNMIIAVSQGMNPFSMKTLKAIELARQAAYSIDRGNTQMISELIALGVLKEGVNIGTLRQFADNFQKDPNKFLEIMQGKIAEHSTKAAETFGKARGAAAAAAVYAGKPVEFLTNLSEVTETFGKLAIYFNELEVYRKAYTQDNKAAGMTDEEAASNAEQRAKQKAAEICNRVYPTKGERIQAIRAFADSPWSALIAPFAGFKSEMFRTVINTYDVAREQMRSDNPIIQAQGKRRLASAMAVHVAITSVLPVLLSSIAGIEDEEQRSIREAMPSYAKNSNFFFIRDGKNLISLDATFANPFSLVIDPFTSMGRAIGSGDFSDIPGIVSRTVSDELLGENIAFGRVMDVRRNQDETTGRPIYLPTDTPLDKTMKSMMHVFNGAYNPAIFKKIGDSIDASFRPEQADRTLLEAINYSPTGIMTGMFLPTKPRYHRMDDMTFRAMANLRKANSQLWMYTAEMNSPKPMSPETAAALYEKRVDATQRLRRDMHQVVTGFEKLGMTKGEIIRKMVDAGFSRTSAAMLVNRGLVDRPTLSAESEAEMRQRDPARYAAYLKAKNSYARYFYVGD